MLSQGIGEKLRVHVTRRHHQEKDQTQPAQAGEDESPTLGGGDVGAVHHPQVDVGEDR